MKVEMFGTQKMLCHFRSATFDFLPIYKAVQQVREPTPFIACVFLAVEKYIQQHSSEAGSMLE